MRYASCTMENSYYHRVWVSLAIALIASGAYIIGKNIEVIGAPVTISVSGEGKVSAIPDIASLSFGVQTGRQQTAQIAMEKLNGAMNSVMEAVKKVGVEDKDIQTEYLNLSPAYDWTDKGQVPRGFEASQSLRVKVRDLDKIADVLSAATNAGANQVGGVSFTIDDPEELQKEARKEAIEDAQKKAVILAEDLGVKLGKLKGFGEGSYGVPTPMYDRAMEYGIGGGAAAPVLPAGEQEIRTSITLTYEIK